MRMTQGYIKNRFKKRDDDSDLNPSYKRDTEAQIGELFFSREAGKLSFKKGVNDFVRYEESGAGVPYKVFTALLEMGAENIPTATILENTLNVEVYFERADSGDYYAVFDKTLFESPSAYVTLSQNAIAVGNSFLLMKAVPIFFNVVSIQAKDSFLSSDEVLGVHAPAILEIRIYNNTII